MRVTEDFIVREIAGEHILIPVGETAMKIHGMINLSESGHILWEKLQTECSVDDLVAAILAEYDIDEETARADVNEFLNKLKAIGILEA